jgi:TRAP-type C4-dicarboxylate transport system permease large subunit
MNLKKKIKISGLKSKTRSFFTQEYFKSAIVIWLVLLSLAINLAEWIMLKIFVKPVDFPIILHYNVYFGVDMVGNYKSVFLVPLIGLALFLVNFFLSVYFYHRKERIASYLLLMAALMIQLSLLVAVFSIIIINY